MSTTTTAQLDSSAASTAHLAGGGVEETRLVLPARIPTIGQNALCALAGNLTYRAAQWAMLATLAKAGTKPEVAQFGMAQAICNPFIVFAYLQLGPMMSADAARTYSFRSYRRLRNVAMGVAVVVIAAVCWWVPALQSAWPVVCLLALAKFAEAQSDIYHGLLRQADRLDVLAWLQCVRGLFTIAIFAGLYWQTADLQTALAGLLVAWALLVVGLDRPVALRHASADVLRAEPRSESGSELRRLALAALPLGFVSSLAAIYIYIPQYLVRVTAGAEEFAVYVVIVSLPLVFETVVLSAMQASSARFGRSCHRTDRDGFWRLYRQMLVIQSGLGLAGVAAAWLFGRQILTLAYTPEFAQHTDLLLWIMLASAMAAAASFNPVFLALGRHDVYLKLWLLAIAVLLVCSAVLVPQFGARGAAVAVVIANAVRCAANHTAIYRLASRAFNTQMHRAATLKAA